MNERLAVTELADFVHRRGDLHARLDSRTRAEEGIAAQRKLQRGMPDEYQVERRVEQVVAVAGRDLLVGGRIDGCRADTHLIEEYKTTRSDPHRAHAHFAAMHWAQIRLYGALLSAELGERDSQPWTLRLIYVHPDTLATSSFEETQTTAELAAFYKDTLAWYDIWLREHQAHVGSRDATIDCLQFPFAEYRPHQRALAKRAYLAMRDGESLLLEAPTGSGKTMGLLYPALRSLTRAGHQRIFYLTSRTTGADAALDACARLDPGGEYLRVVQITAKAQACAWAGDACDATACVYCTGYYDRIHGALRDLLGRRRMAPEVIADVARTHRVCPFELSLDAARWADVIIGDYNYIFDPMVRLQRFVGDAKMVLLIDESHQLSVRAQEMLSLELDRSQLRAALAEPLPSVLAKRLTAVDRQLLGLNRTHNLAAHGGEQRIGEPTALLAAIDRLVDGLGAEDIDLADYPLAQEACFACVRWARSRSWYVADACIYTASASRRSGGFVGTNVRLVHLDPGIYLAEVLAGYAGHIRFSGTVSPLPLYQRLHGMSGSPAERAESPFTADQLQVCVVGDVPTLYRQRERGLPHLATLIEQVVGSQPGNYLVAFPSFEYLEACARQLRATSPDLHLREQGPGMAPEARAAFLAELQRSEDDVVALVVLGGVFAESVNLANEQGSTLAGVICVGVGLPPPSVTRDAMAGYFDDQGEHGMGMAYHQPAMNRVLQAAGRLLRDPDDKGALVLVDARFNTSDYQRFFPPHWRPVAVAADAVASVLEKFWRLP